MKFQLQRDLNPDEVWTTSLKILVPFDETFRYKSFPLSYTSISVDKIYNSQRIRYILLVNHILSPDNPRPPLLSSIYNSRYYLLPLSYKLSYTLKQQQDRSKSHSSLRYLLHGLVNLRGYFPAFEERLERGNSKSCCRYEDRHWSLSDQRQPRQTK